LYKEIIKYKKLLEQIEKNGRILRVDSKLCDAFEDEGMVLVNRMIWFKNNPLYESNNGFQKSMEYILHFVKDPNNHSMKSLNNFDD
jgi:hypothetical protein